MCVSRFLLLIFFINFQFSFAKTPQTIFFDKISTKTCFDSVVVLNASASSGLPVEFRLIFGNAILENNQLTILGIGTIILNILQNGNTEFEPASNIIHSFEITNSWNSSQNLPTLSFKTNYCDSEPIILSVTKNNKLKYQWKTAENQIYYGSKIELPPFSTSVSGLYTISISEGFCSVFNYQFQVNILSTSGFTITEIPSQIFDDAKPIELKASHSDVKVRIDNTESYTFNPAEYTLGKHTILYTLKNAENACSRILKKEILIVENTEITIFELVTPNFETNSTFYIQNITKNPNNKVLVFSKSGQKIFETYSYKNDWSPKELPSGSYFYHVLLPEKNKELKGLIYISN